MKYSLRLVIFLNTAFTFWLSAATPTPPFQQCPALGADTSCAVLIVFDPNGSPSVLADPKQGPYDTIEDTLIGVQNNSNKPVFSISISSATNIFGFDQDGVCGTSPVTGKPYVPRPSGCPFGPTGYEGPGVTFQIKSAFSGIVNFANGIQPGGSAYFTLEEANFAIDLCGLGAAPVVEQISAFGSCGPTGVKTPKWGQFGAKAALVADSGEKLELQCDGGTNPATGQPYLPSFHLYYTPAGAPAGTRFTVGTCPFVAGCNSGYFTHAGRNPATGNPGCIVGTMWTSRDYGDNDVPNPWLGAKAQNPETPPVLDWAVTSFNAVTNNLTKTDLMYTYAIPGQPPVPSSQWCALNPNPKPEGTLLGTITVDPPLGPATEAFFGTVFRNMQLLPQTSDGPMIERPFSLADLNADGKRDILDFMMFRNAFGSCIGKPNYNADADLDSDGCVTFSDYQIWYQLFNAK